MTRGVPFAIAGFYSLGSRTSVQKVMSRLAQEGVVERVSKGLYVRPKTLPSIPSIKTTASAEQVAKAWAKERGYKLVIQGEAAAYRLGFQTQAPMKTVYWSNGPSRQFRIGNQVVEVCHVSRQKLRWGNAVEGIFLRALLVTPSESMKLSSLKRAVQRLSLSPEETRLVLHKLRDFSLLKAWQEKLKQFEQSI